jgi:hypothetical protein
MSELSKQALVVDNNQSFPNNNNGAITPSILRAFNTNMIDSTVNQTQYTTDSGSWNAQIDALEQFSASFTGSTVDTGSLLLTASFDNGTRNLTFTKGDATTFAVNIPDVSGSTFDTGSFATTGSNTFTGDQTFIDNANNFFTITDASGSMMLVGKSITSSIILVWYLLFNHDKNAMILANVGDTAEELMDKIKSIIKGLPFYMKPGMVVNNVMTMRFDNGCRFRVG